MRERERDGGEKKQWTKIVCINLFYQLLLFVYRTHTSYVSATCVAR